MGHPGSKDWEMIILALGTYLCINSAQVQNGINIGFCMTIGGCLVILSSSWTLGCDRLGHLFLGAPKTFFGGLETLTNSRCG